MVTGASTADLAVILIDARKGVLTQTRRHSYLVSLLGIRKVVLAVNKMDLVDYAEEVFDDIVADYRDFAEQIGLDDVTAIPLSALQGDNITRAQRATRPGTTGPTLLGYLETVEVDDDAPAGDAVPHAGAVGQPARTSTSAASPARSSSGIVKPGDAIRVLPSGRESTRRRASSPLDGDLDEAVAGQSVTLTLADEIDISRGDVICRGRRAGRGRRPVRGARSSGWTRSRCCRAAPT